MVKLYSYRAHDGDFFWLKFKQKAEESYHNIVVDGGRKSNADDFCKMLNDIATDNEKVDAIILTHYDRDHIMGMLTGLQRARKKQCIPVIERILLNTGKGYLQQHEEFRVSMTQLPEEITKVPLETPGYSAGDAENLIAFLKAYGLDEHLKEYIVQSLEPIEIGGTKLHIISPDENMLSRLIQSWPGLETSEERSAYGGSETEWETDIDELMGQNALEDSSTSNGASIAFVFEYEDIRIAFLGDAYSSVCIDGLSKLGYSKENPCEVDLIKLSHHGSKHNCSEELFQILKSKN